MNSLTLQRALAAPPKIGAEMQAWPEANEV